MREYISKGELYVESDEAEARFDFSCNPFTCQCSEGYIALYLPTREHLKLKSQGYSLLLRRAEAFISAKWVGPEWWIRRPTVAVKIISWDGQEKDIIGIELPCEERWIDRSVDITSVFAGPGVTGNVGIIPFKVTVYPSNPITSPCGNRYVIDFKIWLRAAYRVVA